MKHKLLTWMADKQGVTAIEYSFLIGFIGSAILVGSSVFSGDFNDMQNVISGYLNSVDLG
jgi:Flp pilus assembly pilin Flp